MISGISISDEFRKFIESLKGTDLYSLFVTFFAGGKLYEYITECEYSLNTSSAPNRPRLVWEPKGWGHDITDERTGKHRIIGCEHDAYHNKQEFCEYWLREGRLRVVRSYAEWSNETGGYSPARIQYDPNLVGGVWDLLMAAETRYLFVFCDDETGDVVSRMVYGLDSLREYKGYSRDYIVHAMETLCIEWHVWMERLLFDEGIVALYGMYSAGINADGELVSYMGSSWEDNPVRNRTGKYRMKNIITQIYEEI